MIRDDREKTEVRRDRMERTDDDAAQKAKIVFLSLAAVVFILLIFSFVYANRARNEKNAALKEVEALKQDNAKLSQWLEERTQEVEKFKKALDGCKGKPKAKTAAKSKPAPKSAKKKPSKAAKSK